MSISRLTKFQKLTRYRDARDPYSEDHFYSCLKLSEMAHTLHVRHGTAPDSTELWGVFYSNPTLDKIIGDLNVSLTEIRLSRLT